MITLVLHCDGYDEKVVFREDQMDQFVYTLLICKKNGNTFDLE